MALRINDFVIHGEISNIQRNSVAGKIQFTPDWGVWIHLTGNLTGQFAGKRFRFRVNKPDSEIGTKDLLPDSIQLLGNPQVGQVGDVLLRQVKIPTVPIKEFVHRSKSGEAVPVEIKDCLYLEWYSQNGRVVAELVDFEIEFVDGPSETMNRPVAEPLPAELDDPEHLAAGPSFTIFRIDEDGNESIEEIGFEEPPGQDDEYGLFASDLDQQIRQSLAEDSEQAAGGPRPESELDASVGSGNRRPWSELIPGLDPETLAKYEMWDEIYDGEQETPVMGLFENIPLPDADSLATDDEAASHLEAVIKRLAEFNIAIEMCEHMTPLSAYRILMKDLLPDAGVHPNLAATNIIEHFCTWEYCRECKAEMDGEFGGSCSDEQSKSENSDQPSDD